MITRFPLLCLVPASLLMLSAQSLSAASKLVASNAKAPLVVSDPLMQGWNVPPQPTKPFVYWYWLNNIVTKQGITRDLEMMAKNGIGGAYIGHIGGFDDTPTNGRTVGYSKEWYALLQHTVREGLRVGVKIGVFNSPGWSQSGGPWVKPEDSMTYIDSTEVRVLGGSVNQVLPRVK
ncbi:hypothetical protein EON80_27980, partial [bacterium]